MELLLTGDLIDAAQAEAIGFLNYVVPADEVMGKALEIAEKIARNGPIAVKAIRKSARACLGLAEREALKLENEISGTRVPDRGRQGRDRGRSWRSANPAIRDVDFRARTGSAYKTGRRTFRTPSRR